MKNIENDSERKREMLRQKELKKNPTGNLRDGFDRGQIGSLIDLVGSLSWKSTGIIIVGVIIIFILVIIFR